MTTLAFAFGVAAAAPGWTEADLHACEAQDTAACHRLLDGSAREAVTAVQGRGAVPTTGELFVHFVLACRGGVAAACVASLDPAGACARGLDAGCAGHYPLGCGDQASCPPLQVAHVYREHLFALRPVVFGGGTLALDGRFQWAGEAGGELWAAHPATPGSQGFQVRSAASAREVTVALPPGLPFVGRLFTDGDAVLLSARDRPRSERAATERYLRVGGDGALSPLPGPDGAPLVDAARGWTLWRGEGTVTRVSPDGQRTTTAGEGSARVSARGVVALLAERVALWGPDGAARPLPVGGRPRAFAWSPSGDRLALQFDTVLVVADAGGEVVERWSLPGSGPGLDWVGESSIVSGRLVMGLPGAPPAELPGWVQPTSSAPAEPPCPTCGPPLAVRVGRSAAWADDALWTRVDAEPWTRHPLEPVVLQDGHRRPAWGHRVPVTSPAGFADLLFPFEGWDPRLPDPAANGATREGSAWVFHTGVVGDAAPTAALSRPIDGTYLGSGPRVRLEGSTALHEDGRWLVLHPNPVVDSYTVAYRVDDDHVLVLDTFRQELRVLTRAP